MPSENSAGTSRARRSIIARKSPSRTPSPRQALRQVSHEAIGRDPILLQRIAIAYRDRAIRRSEEHTSELQSQSNLVCRLLLENKKLAVITHSTPLSDSVIQAT